MVSALFDRRHANAEGVIMRAPALFLALAFIAAASPSRAQQNANPLPAGDGSELVAVACPQCHYLGTIAKIRNGPAGWRIFVNNMVLRGAQLNPSEVDKVVDYLARNLGPGIDLPPAKPVALPDGHGKQLVETHCALCHDLERVATVKRSRQAWAPIVASMIAWGAPGTPDEAKAMTDYLAANFGD
jgi:cytochrome c5